MLLLTAQGGGAGAGAGAAACAGVGAASCVRAPPRARAGAVYSMPRCFCVANASLVLELPSLLRIALEHGLCCFGMRACALP